MPRERMNAPSKLSKRFSRAGGGDGDGPQVDGLFVGHSTSRSLFEIVREYIPSLGGVTIVPRKTQIGFSHGRLFAWVWLPQTWIRQAPEGGIALTIALDHPIIDRRVKESVEPYPGRYVNHIVLTTIEGFDAKIRGWLRQAHALAGKPRQRKSALTKR